MNRLTTTVNKLIGKPYECGVYDCNLMVLEFTGFTEQVPPFKNVREGRRALRTATGCMTMPKYLTKHGYTKVEPTLVKNGAVLVAGIHCYLYQDGKVFGVHPSTKTYDWLPIDVKNLLEFEVFNG